MQAVVDGVMEEDVRTISRLISLQSVSKAKSPFRCNQSTYHCSHGPGSKDKYNRFLRSKLPIPGTEMQFSFIYPKLDSRKAKTKPSQKQSGSEDELLEIQSAWTRRIAV